ncbi:MAG: phenylacetic acid degradation protein [marine bacterium B5-7]|nr:MAG: phenylacetic acid degradation protein [marine bacterium B5-7]
MSKDLHATFSMSGLEYFSRVLTGELPLPAMCEAVPMRFTHVGEGMVRLTATPTILHTNTVGGVHGGFAATVIDTVTGCAVHTHMAAGESYTTVSLELKMFRPPSLDEPLFAEGRLINLSRRIGVAEGLIRNGEGKLVAQGTATCMVFR